MTAPILQPLDPDLRALVQRASTPEAAPAEARMRVLERVQALIGPPDGDGGRGGEGEVRGASQGDAHSLRVGYFRRLLPLAATFALGSGVTAVAMHRSSPAPRPAEPPLVVSVASPPAAPGIVKPPADPPDTPGPARGRVPVPVRIGASSSESRNQLIAERQLLDRARGALGRNEPTETLDATARHERDFPNGALVQEREAMAIRALVMLDRAQEARARATRFRARFPESMLLPTIEATGSSPSSP